jgi:ATP-dependent DNA helicase
VIISTLQAIIKPFLLRRLKVDVEKDSIPPKKEYVIYAPLTDTQRQFYDAIVNGGLRRYLLQDKANKEEEKSVDVDHDAPMALRSNKGNAPKLKKKKKHTFDILDGDDEEYFELLESGQLDEATGRKKKESDAEEAGRQHQLKAKCSSLSSFDCCAF